MPEGAIPIVFGWDRVDIVAFNEYPNRFKFKCIDEVSLQARSGDSLNTTVNHQILSDYSVAGLKLPASDCGSLAA